jgi:hypothetical protein
MKPLQDIQFDLGFGLTILFDLTGQQAEFRGHLGDRFKHRFLGDFNI